MSKYYAVVTGMLVLVIGLVAWQDYHREWRRYQRTYFERQEATTPAGAQARGLAERVRVERKLGIVQLVVGGKNAHAERCVTCHLDLLDDVDAHPKLDGRSFEVIGCIVCHGGDPQALTVAKAHLPEEEEEEGHGGGGARPRTYVGPEKCKECHEAQYESWAEKKMYQAMDALKPAERETPECLGCHATGYGRGGYRPEVPPGTVLGYEEEPDPETGERVPIKEPNFAGIGCEACHGPGSEYVEIFESGGDRWQAIREGGLTLPSPQTCVKCHVARWSPDFAYDKYWTDEALHAVDFWREGAIEPGAPGLEESAHHEEPAAVAPVEPAGGPAEPEDGQS